MQSNAKSCINQVVNLLDLTKMRESTPSTRVTRVLWLGQLLEYYHFILTPFCLIVVWRKTRHQEQERQDERSPISKLNIGIPKRTHLKVRNLNSKYDSFRYSLIEATKGRAAQMEKERICQRAGEDVGGGAVVVAINGRC